MVLHWQMVFTYQLEISVLYHHFKKKFASTSTYQSMFLLQSEYVLESVVTKVMNLNLVHVDAHYEIDPDQAQENFINTQRKGQKQLLEYAQLGKEANKK